MNAQMPRRSILGVILAFVLGAALNHTLNPTAIAQDQGQEESVKETVSRLLSVPVFTEQDEKVLNEAGDDAARAITRAVTGQQMESPETGRRILLILQLSFESPQSIIERDNKIPTTALRLLDQLERTAFGRQPNVITNARIEIKHNTSTGQPVKLAASPGRSAIDVEHTEWVSTALAWIDTIKPGMTRKDLLRVFTTEGGLSTRAHRTYVLKQCPLIKVDVEFSISGNEVDDKIMQISKPYLDYEIAD